MTLTVSAMSVTDVPACTRIVNDIIAAGGSTAYEEPYSEADFQSHYLEDAALSLVARDGARVVGFQGCFEVELGIYSIGSFTDRMNPVRGAGKLLFEHTVIAARRNGATAIIAKITSDNTGGLAYYGKMGFADHDVIPDDHTRPDGTKVDRIIKRFEL